MTVPKAPSDLSLWSLHCFCLGARSTPHRIVGFDDNGVILHLAVGGTTIDHLTSRGLEVTASQLGLLEAYGLISRNGDQVETLFPVLGPEAVAELRDRADKAASKARSTVAERAGRVVTELERRGLSGHGHAVVFGHALDGVLWNLLADRGGIPDVTLDVANPYWKGVFWAMYPGRARSAGTNELRGDGATLVMVWDDDSVEELRSLAASSRIKSGLATVTEGTARHRIPEVGPVPVVEVGGVLDELSRDLAGLVVEQMPTPEESLAHLEDTGTSASVEAATVILAHEVIWAMSDVLADSEVVARPSGTGVDGRLFIRIDG